ncbi:immunoglobulin-like domain-containing protein [Brevibacillus brevis]|uniref:immunoglobulin-like domain-containing protein n=1 Tax=Brevibacillus brevis TaxID=1393 RepID=UPI0012FC9DF8|nr:immunoglobulin-like domain-containing protein [Brevibacillus brevis]
MAAGGSYKVNVKNVLDTKYNKIVDFTDTLKLFSDSTPPTVVKAELKANKVRVYFNEPVIATGLSVKVDGVAVAGPYVASTTAGVYYIETPVITNTSLLSAGTHNVTVYDATDAVSGAGNKASILTTSYAVSTDTVAPSVVSVTAKDAYTFKVKFSEPLAAEPGTVTVKKGVVTLPLDNTLDAGGNGIALDTTDTSNTTYLVKVKDVDANNKVYATGEASVNLSVTVSNYKDSADLIGSQFSGSVTLTKDAVAPKVLSAALNTINAGTKTINVKFDEALDTVVTPSLITVKKDGVIIPVVSAVRNADTKSVDIVLNAGHTVTVGTYVVDFAAGAVKDASLNPNADLSTTVAYETAATALVIAPDTDGTVGAGGAGIESGEANVITVNYGEEMLDGAATLSNYKLDGTAFPAGTTIGFIGDKSKVKITLPAGYFAVNTTARVLISTDVKAKSGKVVAANVNPLTANEFNLNFTDNVKPTLAGAKFLVSSMSAPTTNKIELNFSENLGAVNSNAATIADFNVTVNGVKATIASLTDGTAGDSKVVLQTADAINLSQPVVLTVVPVGTDNVAVDVTDVAGNKLTTETTLSVTDKVIDTDAIGNDAVAAANVNAQINALPTAAAAVASDKANVDAAKTAYEALSANAKAQVTPANVTKLNDLVAKMADFDAVLAEKALLDATPKAITLNGDVDQTNLNTNIAKPSITTAGVVATWTNSSDASITVAGGNASQVSRPANGAGSATVTLELTLTKGTASVTVDYTVTVEEDTTA